MTKKVKTYEEPTQMVFLINTECGLCAASGNVDNMTVNDEVELNNLFE